METVVRETVVRDLPETHVIRYMESVVSNAHEMHRLAAADPTFVATITLLTVVYIPRADFIPLFIRFVAKALLLRLVRFGEYYGGVFNIGLDNLDGSGRLDPGLAMRLVFAQIFCQQRHARLYIELIPTAKLRYLRRSLGYFTGYDVCLHGLLSDRSVVDFVQDRHMGKLVAFFMGRHQRLSQRQGGEISPVIGLNLDLGEKIAEVYWW